jgi:hypothetical protein
VQKFNFRDKILLGEFIQKEQKRNSGNNSGTLDYIFGFEIWKIS